MPARLCEPAVRRLELIRTAALQTLFLFSPSNNRDDQFTFGAATEGFSFARFTDGTSVPGGLSVDGLFGAYTSNEPSEEKKSPSKRSATPLSAKMSDLIMFSEQVCI